MSNPQGEISQIHAINPSGVTRALDCSADDELIVTSVITSVVEVEQDTPDDLRVGNHSYISSAWQKQPLILGYSEIYREIFTKNPLTAGYNNINSTAILVNKVFEMENLAYYASVGTVTGLQICLISGGSLYFLEAMGAMTANVIYPYTNHLTLAPGDYIRLIATTSGAGGFINAYLVGKLTHTNL